jgi:Ca2+-transporting ATPase
MAKSNAIIRKLPAVESLGGATVICSDKTGTLTQNKMRVTERHGDRDVLSYAALCNNGAINSSGSTIGDPTEIALIDAAMAAGINKNRLDLEWPRLDELPFDSERKLMTTLHSNSDGHYLIVTKGAPEVLINRCSHISHKGEISELTHSKRRELNELNISMANKALRVIAIAFRKSLSPIIMKEDGLIFAGLLGMIDPPREEVPAAVSVCLQAGIKPVMITGDHVATARAIAKKIGILKPGDLSITGSEISELDEKSLCDRIDNYTVFARVSPEHKVRVVKAFQKRGNVVAMTGDGVNDAPALKAADIGCAMGITGTDVAKGAADMVLTDDNFATIVKAVREGRGIYANIRKAVHFLLSSNTGEIITIFAAILMGWAAPLSAIHLLWVNLVTDSLPAIALGMDPADKNIMLQKPVDAKGGLFAGGLWQRIVTEGFMIGFLALCAFGIGAVYYDLPGQHIVASTMCFATLSISQLIHAFNMRSDASIFKLNPFSNPYLIGALIIGVIMQAVVIEAPLLNSIFKVAPLFHEQWMIIGGLCLVPLVVVEIQKFLSHVTEHNSTKKSLLQS